MISILHINSLLNENLHHKKSIIIHFCQQKSSINLHKYVYRICENNYDQCANWIRSATTHIYSYFNTKQLSDGPCDNWNVYHHTSICIVLKNKPWTTCILIILASLLPSLTVNANTIRPISGGGSRRWSIGQRWLHWGWSPDYGNRIVN